MSVSLVPTARVHEALPSPAAQRGEDIGWRVIGPSDKRRAPVVDMDPALHARMQDSAMRAYRYNPIARRIIDHQIDFVIGNGLAVNSPDENIRKAVRAWWEANNWPSRLRERLRGLYVYGEWLFFPTFQDGMLYIADIVPTKIKAVERDLYDHGVADRVIIDKALYANGRLVDSPTYRTIRTRGGRLDGDIFFFGINRVSGNMRGVSELLTILDYAQLYDDLLFTRAERVKLMSQIYWDLSIDGMSEREVSEWVRSRADLPPAPGSIFAHNASVQLTPTVPDLKPEQHAEDAGIIKSHILMSAGWPSVWFDESSGGRAAADQMAEPAYRHVTALQQELAGFLRQMIDFYLQTLGTPRSAAPWEDYSITFSRPTTRDLQRIGPIMSRIAQLAESAISTGVLSRLETRELIVSFINQLGLVDTPLSTRPEEEPDQ